MAGRQLRGIKGEDAVKVFVKTGGMQRQGKGDHVNVKMPNGHLITILVRGELKSACSKLPFVKLD